MSINSNNDVLVSGFSIQALSLLTPEHAIGVLVSGTDWFELQDCVIHVASGSHGNHGSNGYNGSSGSNGTNGQNAVQQAKHFTEAVEVTGLIVAKLDGTARGGAVFAIQDALGLPVRYVGTGETLEHLEPFEPDAFVDAIGEGDTAANRGT